MFQIKNFRELQCSLLCKLTNLNAMILQNDLVQFIHFLSLRFSSIRVTLYSTAGRTHRSEQRIQNQVNILVSYIKSQN